MSKARAFQATKEFIEEKQPAFSVVNILPALVLGRDDTATDAAGIVRGSNGVLMAPILGNEIPIPLYGSTVHLEDVARAHVQSLDRAPQGNHDFVLAGPDYSAVEFATSFEIVKSRFPQEYQAGLFKFDSVQPPVTLASKVDGSKAHQTFGFEPKGFEEQVVSVVEHYLEMLGQA